MSLTKLRIHRFLAAAAALVLAAGCRGSNLTSVCQGEGNHCGTCGTFKCDGKKLFCDDPGLNACGGCAALSEVPGSACGQCGAHACQGTEAVACVDPGANRCGG